MSYNILESDYRVMDHNDLEATSTASQINWEAQFNILYPSGSRFFNDWVQRQMMYECMGARTNRDIAFSRMNQAENELTSHKDAREDKTETEIGINKYYNKEASWRAMTDLHDYFRDKYKVWAAKYEEIYGTQWDKDAELLAASKASKSKNSTVLNDEAKKKYLTQLKKAPIDKFK